MVSEMLGFDPAQKTGHAVQLPQAQPGAAAAPAQSSGGFFHDLLDILNPLQHLPVIGTIYRAITGEHIGTFEKIAGDTLYGGLWGAVSSVADTAFKAVTGKDIEDTVLALFTGSHPDAGKAAANPSPSQAGDASTPDVAALSEAMAKKGVDSDIASRALSAYRKSIALPDAVLVH